MKSYHLCQAAGQLHTLLPLNSVRTVYILRRHLLKDIHRQLFYLISSPVDAVAFQPGDKFPKVTISLYWSFPKS